MLDAIHALDEICQACNQNRPLPDHLRKWIAGSIGRYLEHDCGDLNTAFGIQQSRGGIPWWREKDIRERNSALCELARAYYANQNLSTKARLIYRLMRRYSGTSWPRDRFKNQMPWNYSGTPQELVWRAFRSGAKMPVSERHLRNLITEHG
jgi:hypothetical protein